MKLVTSIYKTSERGCKKTGLNEFLERKLNIQNIYLINKFRALLLKYMFTCFGYDMKSFS